MRFYDDEGRDLPYEIESIDFDNNSLIAWVRVAELANDKSVFAYWGIPLSSTSPDSSTDGSTWNAGYRGVWHLRSMSETDVLTDSSFYRNHATNVRGITWLRRENSVPVVYCKVEEIITLKSPLLLA